MPERRRLGPGHHRSERHRLGLEHRRLEPERRRLGPERHRPEPSEGRPDASRLSLAHTPATALNGTLSLSGVRP